MNIIYQLPFPDEICHKIVLYAFKSPHIDLQEEIFKRVLSTPIYQKLMAGGGIVKDVDGHITKVLPLQEDGWVLDDDETDNILFDIQVLQGLPHLTTFNLSCTGVWGDIQVLQGLQNLTQFDLSSTHVFGDIQVLQGLQHLIYFSLYQTGVIGNIQVLQGLPNLTNLYLYSTGVTGDKEAFHNYRNTHAHKKCMVLID